MISMLQFLDDLKCYVNKTDVFSLLPVLHVAEET